MTRVRGRPAVLLLILLMLAAACGSPSLTPQPTPADCWVALRAVYRLISEDGAASADELDQARSALDSFIASIGYARYAVRVVDGMLEISLPAGADAEEIRAALRPVGEFQFVPIPPGMSVEKEDAIPPGLFVLFGREGVAEARPGVNEVGEPSMDLTLTDDGAQRLEDWTEDHVGDQLAIVAGGRVVSAPVVREAITGGVLQISGLAELEIQRLLAVLRSPPLPGSLQEVEFVDVAPPSGCP